MDFKNELKKKTSYIESKLKDFQPQEEGYAKTIYEAMNYSLDAGGKRLRPILLMEAYKICGGEGEGFLPFSMALEMIHTYSLIHDDLPALDNDDLRRGKPSNHKVFGEAMAILAGDALLNYSYEVMSEASMNYSDVRAGVEAMNIIARSAGIYGMVAGQVVDVESEGKKIDIDTLKYIHNNKTKALIKGAIEAGAVLAGAEDEKRKKLEVYGDCIGLAFQIVDDILDITGDEKELGKKVGSDFENEKSTYPSLYGLEESRRLADELIEKAKGALEIFGGEAEFFHCLADYIGYRRS